jgi:photosystem II stability/assembly factor-like uncharacterized protein
MRSSHASTPGPARPFFVDDQHGWIVQDTGSHAGFNSADLYRTGNGGASWEKLAVPYGDGPAVRGDVRLADPLHGWMPAGVALYATRDGGHTWTRKPVTAPPGYPRHRWTS